MMLMPLSTVFGASVALRRRRYLNAPDRAERMPVPVVVIGNLTVGGSGKTPLVIALIEALRVEGYTPGVISRGYGGRDTRARTTIAAVDPVPFDAAERLGDEAVLIARRTGAPVFVGRDRPEVARALLAAHRDVDVLLSDARGAGNGKLLPSGPLREPLARLGEVDAIVLNGLETAAPELPDGVVLMRMPFHMELVPGDAYRVNDPTTTRPINSFRGRRLTAAAGIGNPQRFFAMLRGLGLSFHRMPLDDHHRYRTNPFERRNSEAVLMTEKDAVKCARFEESRMWAVPVTAKIDPALVEAILGHIGGSKAAAVQAID
jgi:tetraacyldisaccharide 4'-kinase